MKYLEAKQEFVQAWGVLGSSWGINKTMAQIFALLIISRSKHTVEDIMEELEISRGNASMSLRSLIEWQLVSKTTVKGERKEYFYCDGDVLSLTQKVAAERRKRELIPILDLLERVKDVDDTDTEEAQEFIKTTGELKSVVAQIDAALAKLESVKSKSILRTLLKVFDKGR